MGLPLPGGTPSQQALRQECESRDVCPWGRGNRNWAGSQGGSFQLTKQRTKGQVLCLDKPVLCLQLSNQAAQHSFLLTWGSSGSGRPTSLGPARMRHLALDQRSYGCGGHLGGESSVERCRYLKQLASQAYSCPFIPFGPPEYTAVGNSFADSWVLTWPLEMLFSNHLQQKYTIKQATKLCTKVWKSEAT